METLKFARFQSDKKHWHFITLCTILLNCVVGHCDVVFTCHVDKYFIYNLLIMHKCSKDSRDKKSFGNFRTRPKFIEGEEEKRRRGSQILAIWKSLRKKAIATLTKF